MVVVKRRKDGDRGKTGSYMWSNHYGISKRPTYDWNGFSPSVFSCYGNARQTAEETLRQYGPRLRYLPFALLFLFIKKDFISAFRSLADGSTAARRRISDYPIDREFRGGLRVDMVFSFEENKRW
jgi:hypothetical protein